MPKAIELLLISLLSGCAAGIVPALKQTSAQPGALPLVDVSEYAPSLSLDMRYFGPNNFTGKPVPGYHAAKCLLHPPVAKALVKVEQSLRGRGYALQVYDCYRPTVAVAEFMRWAKAPDDPASKTRFYPYLAKNTLVPDYIAEKSGHSKGATVDLGLMDCRSGVCKLVDMGTEFDFFGPQAHTDWPGASTEQQTARKLLLNAMAEQGFSNYALEWWHYTWTAGKLPDIAYDQPID